MIFIEILRSNPDLPTIDELAGGLDYVVFVLRSSGIVRRASVAADSETNNQRLCPREKADDLRQVAAGIGLSVADG